MTLSVTIPISRHAHPDHTDDHPNHPCDHPDSFDDPPDIPNDHTEPLEPIRSQILKERR